MAKKNSYSFMYRLRGVTQAWFDHSPKTLCLFCCRRKVRVGPSEAAHLEHCTQVRSVEVRQYSRAVDLQYQLILDCTVRDSVDPTKQTRAPRREVADVKGANLQIVIDFKNNKSTEANK